MEGFRKEGRNLNSIMYANDTVLAKDTEEKSQNTDTVKG